MYSTLNAGINVENYVSLANSQASTCRLIDCELEGRDWKWSPPQY